MGLTALGLTNALTEACVGGPARNAIRAEDLRMVKVNEKDLEITRQEETAGVADILEEIEIEDLTVDGICGVY
jgi:mycofactocin precursor